MKKLILLLFCSSLLFANNQTIQKSYLQSYNYEQIGKYQDAIKVLLPLHNKSPHEYTLNLRLGWLFYLDGHYTDAIKYYKKASLIKTHALEPLLGLIRVYLTTYSYKKAENISTEILKKDYYNYYANLYISKALIGEKKYKIAIAVINKMLTLYPTDVSFLEELFISYKATNNKYYKNVYKNILILDPNNILVRTTH